MSKLRKIKELILKMTFEEKALILTGGVKDMATADFENHSIPYRQMADGPHGVRSLRENNCTAFPNLCLLAATWDKNMAEKMGNGIAKDCITHDVDMILGPGANIKRTPLCGRNFEYFSEDPILSGEMAGSYIKGVEDYGVGTSLKHFAANNQEKNRQTISVEVDERTLREIYLKSFEIAVKKGNPSSVMCSYNKINSVWAAENKFILDEVLKKEWNYDGFVVSDWGAVQDISRSVHAGLDLQMARNEDIVAQLKDGVEKGKVTIEEIDEAVKRVLNFVLKENKKEIDYNRDEQHKLAQEIASEGIVLLKNDNDVLPLTSKKYKKIAVVGEFATSPLVTGQGSAEVLNLPEYTDSPLEELKKALPECELTYIETYKKSELPKNMLWPFMYEEFIPSLKNFDVVVLFAGSMESEDTEKFDRNTINLNPNYQLFIDALIEENKKAVVVLQSGSALALGEWNNGVDGIVQMYLGGEGSGKAVSDILTGNVNPSGKLPETFPKAVRTDMDYPGDGVKVEYNEKWKVGYRYYDLHTDEIVYPFGHGLSYTQFSYSDLKILKDKDDFKVSVKVKNVGECDGKEVVQLYVGDEVSTVSKPVKELKKFEKISLKKGEEKEISFVLTDEELAYYNVTLHNWVVENGKYNVFVGSSSQDIRLTSSFVYENDMPYTMIQTGKDMIG